MLNTIMLWSALTRFLTTLQLAEYAQNSIRGYRRDIEGLLAFLESCPSACTSGCILPQPSASTLDKASLITYKQHLMQTCKPSTVNRKIAAINQFLQYLGMSELRLKQIKVQPTVFTDKELSQKEFDCLVETAAQLGKYRIAAVMLTLAGTGIRINELQFFTVASVLSGYVSIRNKGKERLIVIPADIQQLLKNYCRISKIRYGFLFVNKQGKPLSRTYLAAEMKRVAAVANIDTKKVFPHNLRHFFARRFLEKGYPLTDLADHLGHKNIDTTRRYLYTTTATRRKQLSRMTICTGLQLLHSHMCAG